MKKNQSHMKESVGSLIKSVVLLFTFCIGATALEMKTNTMYTGWPEKDSLLHGVLQITADSSAVKDRNPIQVVYLVDISEESAGRVRQGLIEGGKQLISSLRNGDRFGIVLYSQYSRTLLPLRELTKDNRAEAIDLLERISTESGRDVSAGLEKATAEFDLRAGEKSDGRFLVLSTLGNSTEGEVGNDLYDALIEESNDKTNGFSIYTVGYGNSFDEDVMIKSAETSGGRAFFAPEERPDSLTGILSTIGNELSNITVKDLDIFTEFPDSKLEICYFGTNTPMPNPIKMKQLSKGETFNLIFSLSNRSKSSASLDMDIDYYSLLKGSSLSITGGTKVSSSNSAIYVEQAAPILIQYSILDHFSESISMFRRVVTEMKPKEAKEFRRNYAYKFQEEVVNRIETVKNEINTPEMVKNYELMNSIFNEMRDGIVDIEYLIRKVKYSQHHTIYGE